MNNITLQLVLSLGEVLQTPDTPCGGATHSQRNVTLRHRLAVVCLRLWAEAIKIRSAFVLLLGLFQCLKELGSKKGFL